MSYQPRISRRQALARIAVLSSTLPMLGCVYPAAPDGSSTADSTAPWPDYNASEVSHPGYGTDPNLIHPPTVPWPGVLSAAQLNMVARLSEAICPGAIAAAVPDVINEWVSAPYPTQQGDRALIEPGLAWYQAECLGQYGKRPEQEDLGTDQLLAPLRSLDQAPETGLTAQPRRFAQRFRMLVTGAYFSSELGAAELGYMGNVPIAGDYPGPSDAAKQHLNTLLADLGLTL